MFASTIRVKASRASIACYQELLRADWSRATLDEVLALLGGLVADGVSPDVFPWQEAFKPTADKKSADDFEPGIIARIRELASAFAEPGVPTMPEHFPLVRPTRTAAQAEQAWAFLVLQALARLDGDTGFFQDAQSLLLLCAAHFLLPQLQHQRLIAEHDCLACAMYLHTLLVWKTEPAHLLHLQGVLMDQLGNRERRLQLLDMVFLLTPPEDHAYLTRATAYWSELMDVRQHEKAARFLFSLAKHAPDACQDEIRSMLSETLLAEKNGSVYSARGQD